MKICGVQWLVVDPNDSNMTCGVQRLVVDPGKLSIKMRGSVAGGGFEPARSAAAEDWAHDSSGAAQCQGQRAFLLAAEPGRPSQPDRAGGFIQPPRRPSPSPGLLHLLGRAGRLQ